MRDFEGSTLWLLLMHFGLLSVASIGGGVIALMPEMHRFVVDNHGWLTSEQFAAAFTIGQASPGPNVLFVTIIGWQIAGLAGAVVVTLALMVPPMIITLFVTHMSAKRTSGRLSRAVRSGITPLAVGMLLATGWLLARTADTNWRRGLATIVATYIMVRYSINPVWLILVGAVAGVAGLI